ncbi:MAG: HlyD family secretion protein [Prevotella sp.]|nr:HlyD family secretion protein [Prevotella sp.]MCD8305514.1 HlyD family secretion protein [Prevotella sp.]
MKGLNKKNVKRAYNIFVIVILLLGVAYVCNKFVHVGSVEYTNNAQVYRHITPINTRVRGFIKEIRFSDYQQVKRGDTLIIIEDSEFRLQLAQAQANVKGSRSSGSAISASMNTTQSNVKTEAANIEEARVEMVNARTDLSRYENLLAKEAVTRQQYDEAKTKYEAAKARYTAATNRRNSASLVEEEQKHQLSNSDAQVSVAEAEANLARLNLSYTVITATCDGKIGRKQVLEGQLVEPGQTLAEIVDDNDVWIIANYRERQMGNIQLGNEVKITADAIPGVTFRGVVDVISGATGAAFSKVPTDNATGNFVKVEQRIPVRIRLTEDNDEEAVARLLAGMNVETEVKY